MESRELKDRLSQALGCTCEVIEHEDRSQQEVRTSTSLITPEQLERLAAFPDFQFMEIKDGKPALFFAWDLNNAENIKARVTAATGVACEVEVNTMNGEILARTGCYYLQADDLDGIRKAGQLLRIVDEGGHLTAVYRLEKRQRDFVIY